MANDGQPLPTAAAISSVPTRHARQPQCGDPRVHMRRPGNPLREPPRASRSPSMANGWTTASSPPLSQKWQASLSFGSLTLIRQRTGSQSCGLDALRRGTRRVSARLDRSWSAPRACQHSAGAYTWPHSRSQRFGRALTAENAQSTSLGSTEIRQTSSHALLDSIAATTPNSQRRHGPAAPAMEPQLIGSAARRDV